MFDCFLLICLFCQLYIDTRFSKIVQISAWLSVRPYLEPGFQWPWFIFCRFDCGHTFQPRALECWPSCLCDYLNMRFTFYFFCRDPLFYQSPRNISRYYLSLSVWCVKKWPNILLCLFVCQIVSPALKLI